MATPLEIQIMLHYYSCVDDFNNGDFSAPAVSHAIDEFKSLGLLENTKRKSKYQITDMGNYYVEYLKEIPFPCKSYYIVRVNPPIVEIGDKGK